MAALTFLSGLHRIASFFSVCFLWKTSVGAAVSDHTKSSQLYFFYLQYAKKVQITGNCDHEYFSLPFSAL